MLPYIPYMDPMAIENEPCFGDFGDISLLCPSDLIEGVQDGILWHPVAPCDLDVSRKSVNLEVAHVMCLKNTIEKTYMFSIVFISTHITVTWYGHPKCPFEGKPPIRKSRQTALERRGASSSTEKVLDQDPRWVEKIGFTYVNIYIYVN